MKDFTLQTYRLLLNALHAAGYKSLTFEDYCTAKQKGVTISSPFVIFRHDVDLKAGNSLKTALVEAELGMHASYYFRVVPESNQPDIIRQIARLGHEIGYHYEDMSIASGDFEEAFSHFEQQLAYFRSFYPVKTICMHGAPTSRFDSKDLWKHYDYHDLGIIGEPYFDVDYSNVVYLTDTGRCWDGFKVSVRDKIEKWQDEWIKEGLVFHTTEELIHWLKDDSHKKRNLLITTHPQRWTDNNGEWTKELVSQQMKNIVKRLLVAVK